MAKMTTKKFLVTHLKVGIAAVQSPIKIKGSTLEIAPPTLEDLVFLGELHHSLEEYIAGASDVQVAAQKV